MINNFVDKIYFINLDRRKDRLQKIMTEFERVGIDAERVSAIDKNDLPYINYPVNTGNIACAMSHLKIVKDAKNNNYKRYLVFEDDSEFHPNFVSLFNEWSKELPKDFDMLYLGANHNSGVEYFSPHICKCIASYTTHAFMASNTIYDSMISVWENQQAEIDVCLSKLHQYFNCYCFIPNLVWQSEGYSDILDGNVNYDFMKKSTQILKYT